MRVRFRRLRSVRKSAQDSFGNEMVASQKNMFTHVNTFFPVLIKALNALTDMCRPIGYIRLSTTASVNVNVGCAARSTSPADQSRESISEVWTHSLFSLCSSVDPCVTLLHLIVLEKQLQILGQSTPEARLSPWRRRITVRNKSAGSDVHIVVRSSKQTEAGAVLRI